MTTRNVHHTGEIVVHERKTERSLVPFGIVITLLALGFIIALVMSYR